MSREDNRAPERRDDPIGNRGPACGEIVKRFDRLGVVHCDPARTDGTLAKVDPKTGFLRADARLTRVGVFQYADADGQIWGELRTEDEVFSPESMASFEQVPLTDEHPSEFVTLDNVAAVQKGTIANIRRDGNYLVGTVVVTDADLIAKMKDGKRELSMGYMTQAVPEQGRADGQEYSYRQTQIRGNHGSCVGRGRAGPECRIQLDSGAAVMAQGEDMTDKTTETADDQPAPKADATKAERKAAADVNANEDGSGAAFPPDDDDEEEMEDSKQDSTQLDVAALQARIDMLEAEAQKRSDQETARIDARAKLLAKAETIVPEFVTDGASNPAIRRAIVLAINPGMEAKLDAHKGDEGYLLACYDQALDLHANRVKYDGQGSELANRIASSVAEAKTDLDDAVNSYFDRYDMSTHAERAAKWEQH